MALVALTIDRALQTGNYHTLPLTTYAHHGSLAAYVAYPFTAVFGHRIVVVRSVMIAVGAVTLILLYFAGRRLFGRGVAVLACVLLAIHPSYLVGSRVGAHHANLLLLLSALSVLCFFSWWDNNRRRDWILLSAVVGLGLSCMSWWIFWLGACLAAAATVGPRLLKRLKATPRSWWAAGGAAAAATGSALLFAQIFQGTVVPYLLRHMEEFEQGLWAFRRSVEQFVEILRGGGLRNMYFSPLSAWPFDENAAAYVAAFAAAAVWLLLRALRRPAAYRPQAALLALVCGYVLAASFNPTFKAPNHLFTALPWAVLLIAAGLHDGAVSLSKTAPWGKTALLSAAGGALLLSAGVTSFEYLLYLDKTGGVSAATSAINEASEYLSARKIRSVWVAERLHETRFRYLLPRETRIVRANSVTPERVPDERIDEAIRSNRIEAAVVPWMPPHARAEAIFLHYGDYFEDWFARRRHAVRLSRSFIDKSGLGYLIYDIDRESL